MLLCFAACSQTARTENPFGTNLPCAINVQVSFNESYDHDKCLKGGYTINVIGGQHIIEADSRLLKTVYGAADALKIPPTIRFKACEIYINMTSDEEQLIVTLHNKQLFHKNQFFDKVCEQA